MNGLQDIRYDLNAFVIIAVGPWYVKNNQSTR